MHAFAFLEFDLRWVFEVPRVVLLTRHCDRRLRLLLPSDWDTLVADDCQSSNRSSLQCRSLGFTCHCCGLRYHRLLHRLLEYSCGFDLRAALSHCIHRRCSWFHEVNRLFLRYRVYLDFLRVLRGHHVVLILHLLLLPLHRGHCRLLRRS